LIKTNKQRNKGYKGMTTLINGNCLQINTEACATCGCMTGGDAGRVVIKYSGYAERIFCIDCCTSLTERLEQSCNLGGRVTMGGEGGPLGSG
jgi:hypothetical protein